jgi:hypothetical protein
MHVWYSFERNQSSSRLISLDERQDQNKNIYSIFGFQSSEVLVYKGDVH